MGAFETLNDLNINGHTEIKNVGGKDLTYLSWPWAWAEVKKRYPDAHYTIWKNADGLPYTEDPITGYMVYTSVTIDGNTHEMWLPVMDGANRAMRRTDYDYKVKNPNFRYAKKQEDGRYLDSYGREQTEFFIKHCEAATMMDINKTIMRCLVKNLAMFGLGLYIYAGEDLPETEKDQEVKNTTTEKTFTPPKTTSGQAVVTMTDKVPSVPEIKQTKVEPNPVQVYLTKAMKELREERQITPKENNKLFADQLQVLIDKGLTPNKKTSEYTMKEAEALIDMMYHRFPMKSAELIEK